MGLRRRHVIQLVPALGAFAFSANSRADDLLKETDDEAKATGYQEDPAKIDRKKFPKYAPGQTCANCSLFAPEAGKPSGGCALFYDKDVLAKAWCNSWEPKA
jgi:hypothetical protein